MWSICFAKKINYLFIFDWRVMSTRAYYLKPRVPTHATLLHTCRGSLLTNVEVASVRGRARQTAARRGRRARQVGNPGAAPSHGMSDLSPGHSSVGWPVGPWAVMSSHAVGLVSVRQGRGCRVGDGYPAATHGLVCWGRGRKVVECPQSNFTFSKSCRGLGVAHGVIWLWQTCAVCLLREVRGAQSLLHGSSVLCGLCRVANVCGPCVVSGPVQAPP